MRLLTKLGLEPFFFFYFINAHRQEHTLQFLTQKSDFIEAQYKVISNNHRDIAEIIFKTQIDKPNIKKLLKSKEREKLYETLIENYRELRKFSVRQLHFHLPNNDSFLRMHRPKKFGDNLTKVRQTVAYVNKHKKYVCSFEEGKIFNGFRYVYPLFLEHEHIGSVEISFSAHIFVDEFFKNYGVQSNFLIKKSIVDTKLFHEERSNYMVSPFENYYYQDSILRFLKSDVNIHYWSTSQKEKIEKLIEEGDVFSLYNDKYHQIVTFVPLKKKLTNTIVGAMSFRSYDADIDKEMVDAILLSSIVTIALFLTLLLVYKDIIYKDELRLEVNYRTHELLTMNKKLDQVANEDMLTGAFNRRYFYDKVEEVIENSEKRNKTFSIAMIDIDKFKNINDTYGHDEGDRVLKSLVETIQSHIREDDIFVRFGGEEFIVLFPNTTLNQAVKISKQLRELIEKNSQTQKVHFTISIGVSEFYLQESIEETIKRADEALYRAKDGGRNRVESRVI